MENHLFTASGLTFPGSNFNGQDANLQAEPSQIQNDNLFFHDDVYRDIEQFRRELTDSSINDDVNLFKCGSVDDTNIFDEQGDDSFLLEEFEHHIFDSSQILRSDETQSINDKSIYEGLEQFGTSDIKLDEEEKYHGIGDTDEENDDNVSKMNIKFKSLLGTRESHSRETSCDSYDGSIRSQETDVTDIGDHHISYAKFQRKTNGLSQTNNGIFKDDFVDHRKMVVAFWAQTKFLSREVYEEVIKKCYLRDIRKEYVDLSLQTIHFTRGLSFIDNEKKRPYNLVLRIKILCYLIELEKRKKKNQKQISLLKLDPKFILSRLPVFENDDGTILFQVRTSNGEESIEKLNPKASEFLEIFSKDKSFELKFIENLTQFKILSSLFAKQTNFSKRSRKVKRPLNTFILYRASCLRAVTFLHLLKQVDDILDVYFEKFLVPHITRATELTSINEKSILQLIEKDLIELIFEEPQSRSQALKHFLQSQDKQTQATSIITFVKSYELHNSTRFKYLKELNIVSNQKGLKFDHAIMCHTISTLWRFEPIKTQEVFREFSKVEKDVHTLCNPGYKYSPNRDKSQTSISSTNSFSNQEDLIEEFTEEFNSIPIKKAQKKRVRIKKPEMDSSDDEFEENEENLGEIGLDRVARAQQRALRAEKRLIKKTDRICRLKLTMSTDYKDN